MPLLRLFSKEESSAKELVMLWEFAISDAVLGSVSGALCGGLIAGGVVGYLTQRWIERRELRNRRDSLRLDLYQDVIDLVLENELTIAQRSAKGEIPPADLQAERLRILHRLKLLASTPVNNAYNEYNKLVFQTTTQDIKYRPQDPDDVVRARDNLIAQMTSEVRHI